MSGIATLFWPCLLVGGGCGFILAIAAFEVVIGVLWVALRLLIRGEVVIAGALGRFRDWIEARSRRRRMTLR
jgi:hypothetical protein